MWRREHGCTRIGYSRSCSGYPPLDPVREWRRESEVNDANQDIAGDGEEGHRKEPDRRRHEEGRRRERRGDDRTHRADPQQRIERATICGRVVRGGS